MKLDNKLISITGSHDASCVFVDKNDDLRVFEYERFVDARYAMFSTGFDQHLLAATRDPNQNESFRREFLSYVKSQLKELPERIICHDMHSENDFKLFEEFFPNADVTPVGRHHSSHAACGYYQSPFQEAIIFTVDGGGLETDAIEYIKVFYASGEGSEFKLLDTIPVDLSKGYTFMGVPIKDIPPGKEAVPPYYTSLADAGKIMGLCAYGNVKEEWISPVAAFYQNYNFEQLQNSIGLNLSHNSLEGQVSYDFAATSQYVFEEILFNIVDSYFQKYNTNIIMSGGCALNVLFNQRLKKYINQHGFDVYVPPNPNDCGLALGQYLLEIKSHIEPVVYGGFDILDREDISSYLNQYNYQSEKVSVEKVYDLIVSGKIGGVINGYSEVGPRALGNRSIICDPSIKDMKDIINSKVKFREWFRPFAPVCREEDKNLYFDDAFTSTYMSYAPMVNEKYRELLPSITHFDGTSRLQTVTQKQNEFLYNLLSYMNDQNKIPVLLNTSFNIKGRPILTKVKDAFHVLNTTELDFLIIENLLIIK